ncbi:cysteine desulfurase family protein [Synechococcus sp. PCC 7336]|uniref:cysteine desulfurase family protein n=1 Tax=Synechococcus sp. PCC 7336 TaxID=195250 RepID=UPI00034D7E2E|nr:cysteine desulfurase family protein [Synechococcus sp. PCC 7336]
MLGELDPTLYFDHSATTPTRPEAIAAMQRAMRESWGNPSSLHGWGQRAAIALETARQQVADSIEASSDRIAFTSGGTEADNLAIFGIARQYDTPQHMAISSVEHSAVENAARQLEREGWQVSRVPVTRAGLAIPTALAEALRPNTVLVSIVHGQSEVGAIQPIAQLAAICRESGILFHSDCVQTAGRLPLSVNKLGVDLLSLSSHKIYGPQGAGALFVREGVEIAAHLLGGKQEGGWRAGTQALPAIAGFGVAAELAQQELEDEVSRLRSLQQRLATALAPLDSLVPTGPQALEHRLPHHLSYCTAEHTGTWLVRQLSLAGFAISAGSACNSGQLVPSRTLLAMGYEERFSAGGIRLTLGKATTAVAVDRLVEAIAHLLQKSPLPIP